MRAAVAASLVALLTLPTVAAARPGTLDPTFGTNGRVVAANGGSSIVYGLFEQSDGRILTLGYGETTRYLADGRVDSSYGNDGTVALPFASGSWRGALLPDDSLLVGGTTEDAGVRIAKLTSEGTLDPTFGANGVATLPSLRPATLYAIVMQPDGKALLTGEQALSVARLLPDGSLDPTFGSGGIATNPVATITEGIALQPDGAIVVGGSKDVAGPGTGDFVLTRFDTNGAVDTTFGTGGVTQTDPLGNGNETLNHLVLQSDGVIAVGQSLDANDEWWFVMVRYVNGVVDPFFGVLGVTKVNFTSAGAPAGAYTFPWASAVDDAGRIVTIGTVVTDGTMVRPFVMSRLAANGTLDASFGSGGKVLTPFPTTAEALAVTVTADQRIVVGGDTSETSEYLVSHAALARYAGGGGDLPNCAPTRDFTCDDLSADGKSIVKITNTQKDQSDQLAWQWSAPSARNFGDPTTTDDYVLCLYEESDGVWPPLRYAAGVNAGGTCNGKPCWKAGVTGFAYQNGKGGVMGISQLKLKQAHGVTKIDLKGRGANLGGMDVLPVTMPAVMQLHAGNGQCWSATFSGSVVQKARQLKAVARP